MHTILLVIHVVLAIAIVGLILIQQGKGAQVGAAFGGGASGTVFGSRGSATFMSKATAMLSTGFIATSLALAFIATQTVAPPESIADRISVEETGSQNDSGIRVQSTPAVEVEDDVPAVELDPAPPAADAINDDVPATDAPAEGDAAVTTETEQAQ